MGENSPRTSTGASGLRSQTSMWDGPPGRKTMMTDLWLLRLPLAASARSRSGNVSPPSPSAPTVKKERRLMPSQRFVFLPVIRSIVWLETGKAGGPETTSHDRQSKCCCNGNLNQSVASTASVSTLGCKIRHGGQTESYKNHGRTKQKTEAAGLSSHQVHRLGNSSTGGGDHAFR